MTRIQWMESMMAKKPGFVPPPGPPEGLGRLLAAHTASVLADRLVQMAALAVAVASASQAAATSAWILFWATIPPIVLAPLAGRSVDRFPRTRILMLTDAARAILSAGLMMGLSRSLAPSALYAGVALVASAACFFTPARLAPVGKHLRQLRERLLLPFGDHRWVHPIHPGDLIHRPVSPDRRQGHLGLDLGCVLPPCSSPVCHVVSPFQDPTSSNHYLMPLSGFWGAPHV